jgi:hypothetical protein
MLATIYDNASHPPQAALLAIKIAPQKPTRRDRKA